MKRHVLQAVTGIIAGMLLLTACGSREAVSTEPEQPVISTSDEAVPVYLVSEEVLFNNSSDTLNADANTSTDALEFALRLEYEYDADGNKTRQTGCDSFGNSNTCEYEYAVETDGIRVKETRYSKGSGAKQSADYQYDVCGEMTERAYYIGNNHVVTRFYDAKVERSAIACMLYQAKAAIGSHEVIRYISYENEVVTEFATAQYDAEGNRIKETLYFADGSLMYSYEYEYDAAGNMTLQAVYDADGTLLSMGQFEYRCDECGNVLEKKRYLNGDFIGLTKYSYVQRPSQRIL